MEKHNSTSYSHRRRVSWPRLVTSPNSHRRIRIIAALLLTLGLIHALTTSHAARTALSQKYSPTVYSKLSAAVKADVGSGLWQHSEPNGDATEALKGSQESSPPHRYSRVDLLAHRDEWKPLGSGFEGRIFTYADVVVKIYRTDNAPFRNCVPGAAPELRWPTEILASLVLGGRSESEDLPTLDGGHFLPVVDYFYAPSSPGRAAEWHLVTPFLARGNLGRLSHRLRESQKSYTAIELDALFRPSLEHTLNGLGKMHTEHDLCHDDIKLDNIFLAPMLSRAERQSGETRLDDPAKETRWLLADLGNARQPDHAYHSSILWSSLNDNHPDCRVNDVLRLMKTYVVFLRESVAAQEVGSFDEDLFRGKQAWSRLFWRTHDAAASGRAVAAWEVAKLSKSLDQPEATEATGFTQASSEQAWPGQPDDDTSIFTAGALGRAPVGFWDLAKLATEGREAVVAEAVERALHVSAREGIARGWGLVPLLGMPVPECEHPSPDAAIDDSVVRKPWRRDPHVLGGVARAT